MASPTPGRQGPKERSISYGVLHFVVLDILGTRGGDLGPPLERLGSATFVRPPGNNAKTQRIIHANTCVPEILHHPG